MCVLRDKWKFHLNQQKFANVIKASHKRWNPSSQITVVIASIPYSVSFGVGLVQRSWLRYTCFREDLHIVISDWLSSVRWPLFSMNCLYGELFWGETSIYSHFIQFPNFDIAVEHLLSGIVVVTLKENCNLFWLARQITVVWCSLMNSVINKMHQNSAGFYFRPTSVDISFHISVG